MTGSLFFGRVLAAALGLSLVLSSVASAQEVDDSERNAARSLASQAKDQFDRGDYEKAQDLFHRAYQLVQAPTISLYEARALVQLGRLVEAEEAYTRTVRTQLAGESSEQFRKAVREAEPELAALQPRIPRLIIAVTGAGATDPALEVRLDGELVKSALVGVEMPINPGKHTVTARAGAGRITERSVTVLEKERQSIELEVAPAPAPPPPAASDASSRRPRAEAPPDVARGWPWQRKAAFVAGGVGVAGLGLGIVTGVIASSRYAKAEDECPQHRCIAGSAGDEALQSFRSLKTVSTVGYIVGGVGIAAGVTLFVTAPARNPRQARLGVFLTGDRAGVVGAF